MLDRLITKGPVPSIIRTGSAPKEGVWRKDRLRLAGHVMLAEEIVWHQNKPRSSRVSQVGCNTLGSDSQCRPKQGSEAAG